MEMIRIQYVGKKPMKDDNVAGTETVWDGPGDVQEVPEDKAPLLLAHPGVWQVAPPEAAAGKKDAPPTTKVVATPKVRPNAKKKGIYEDHEEESLPVVDFNRLGKDKLEAFARRHFKVELDQRKSLKELREKVTQMAARHQAGLRK